MAALMQGRPGAATVAAVLAAQFRVYAAVEAALFAAPPAALARHPGYQPRAPLAAADLSALGAAVPPMPRPRPAFASDAAWWGWFYVVDGASLGGAVITRRLAETAPDLPRLRFFDPYGDRRGLVWRTVCDRLDATFADPVAAADVLEGAETAFALFADALEAEACR